MCSDLTLGPKIFITHLFLILEFCNVKPTYWKSWAGNLMCSDLTLGPLLQGQTRIAKLKKLKVLITHLFLVRCLQYETKL